MSHPLEQEVQSIGRRAQRLVAWHGWFSFITVAAVVVFTAGIADYLLRFQDRGLRIIASSSVLAAVVWAFLRFVVPVITWRWGDIRIAQHIERRFPELSDQLSTAIAFLRQPENDSGAGSPALRAAAVQQAARAVAQLRLRDCLDSRPFRRAAFTLLGIATLVGFIGLRDPGSASFAARRLAWPLGHESWPRRNVLMFTRQPTRLAIGQEFEVELVDKRGHLPERVVLQYRYSDDASEPVQSKAMKPWGKPVKPWGERMVCRLEDVSRSFEYRAVGGDDDTMDWIRLEVVEPPRIVDLQVHVDPPPYMHLPAERVGRHIRAWEGTCIRLEGQLDKPLRNLSVISETSQDRHSISAQLTPDGRRFTVPAPGDQPWVLQASGGYWFDWTDREGYRLPEVMRSEILVQRDAPPTVSIAAPTSESFFTNRAFVPLRVVAKDDLAVRCVEMQYNGTHLELHRASEERPPAERSGWESVTDRGESLTIDYPWDLGQVPEIQPGDTIEFQVTVSDFKPQTGQPATMRIAIISPQELSARVDQRQASIAEQLREALRLQRTAHSQTALLQTALDDRDILSQDDVDYLQATDLNQRQVQSLLAADVGGAVDLIRILLDELNSNRINEPQIINRLTRLRTEIVDLTRLQLPQIQKELTHALKSARADLMHVKAAEDPLDQDRPRGKSLTRAALSTAEAAQDEVIERLELLIGELAEWESYRQLTHDLEGVYREQDDVAQQTSALSTAALPISDLSPRDRAALKRLAQRQAELARTFDRLYSRLGASQQVLSESDPSASAAIGEAVNKARSLAVAGLMRESAGHIDSNRIGQAARLHDELLDGLRELLDQLDPRRERQSLDRLHQLLKGILRREQAVFQRTLKADRKRQSNQGQLPVDLIAELNELAKLQHELHKQTMSSAGDSDVAKIYRFGLERAARPMRQAADLLRSQISDQRVRKAQGEAIDRMQTIVASLDLDQRMSADRAASTSKHSNTETEPATSIEELSLLRAMQVEVNERTVQLHKKQTAVSRIDKSTERQFDQLAEDQSHLASLAEEMMAMSTEQPSNRTTASGGTAQSELDRALQEAGIPGFGTPKGSTDDSGARTTAGPQSRSQPAAGDDVGDPSGEEPVGLRIVNGMRAAEVALRAMNAAAETQLVQREVVADLETLMESVSQSGSEQSSRRPPETTTGSEAGDSPGGDPGHSPSTTAMAESVTANEKTTPGQDSTDQLLIQVWGQLPAHLQEQIQSPAREKFLPQFERIIIEYYRRLAETGED